MLNDMIEMATGNVGNPEIEELVTSDYNPDKSMKWKIMFLLKKKNRFLHSKEIVDNIAKLEGKTEESIKVSPSLSTLKKEIAIAKFQVGKQNRNTFWGIPLWLNENGGIISGHEYNPDLVFEGREDYNSIM